MTRPAPRGQGLLLLLLLSLALALKTLYLLEYAELPFLEGPIADSIVYLQQARAIHLGHLDDPSLLAFSPLYGYFLALFTDGTPSSAAVHVQLLLGCLNLCLIYHLGKQLGDALGGLISACLYLGYGLLLFYESKLLSETLGLMLALMALNLFLSPGYRDGRKVRALACGALLGLSVLARASLLLSTPFFVLASLFPWQAGGPGLRGRCVRTAFLGLGLLAVLGTNGLWNLGQSGVFVPVILVSNTVAKTTSKAWTGNLHALSNTDRARAIDVVEQAERRLSKLRAGDAEDEASPLWKIDLLGLLRGAPAKLYRAFWDGEILFQYGYQGERSEIRTLRFMPISFGSLLVLGLLGVLALALSGRTRELIPLLPLFLGALLTVVMYHPSSRYRLPMVLPLILLGGHGLAYLRKAKTGVRWPALAVALCACLYFGHRAITYRLGSPVRWEMTVAQSATVAGWNTYAKRRLARAERLAPDDRQVRERAREIRELLPPDEDDTR